MEALGVAASVGGIIGLSGQLLQGVIFLHDFFDSITDVPESIRELNHELTALRSILLRLQPQNQPAESLVSQTSINPSAEQKLALEFCGRQVTKLTDLILAYDSKATAGRTRRLWAQLSTALRQKKFDKYTRMLERGKVMLSQAYALDLGERILRDTSLTHNAVSNVTRELSMLGLQNTRHAEITTEIYMTVLSVEADTKNIRSTIATLFDSDNLSRFSSVMQPVVERIVSEAIQKQLEVMERRPDHAEVAIEHVSPQLMTEEDEYCVSPDNSKRGRRPSLENDSRPAQRQRRVYGMATSHDLWFGKVMISTEKVTLDHEVQTINIHVMLLPRPWLFHTGLAIKVTHALQRYAHPAMNYTLRPIDIVPRSHPVFDAIKSGNFAQFWGVFDDRLVSPFAVDCEGNTLSYRVNYRIRSEMNHNNIKIDKFKGRRCNLQSPTEFIEMGEWLLSLGVDSGYAGHDHVSPMEWLYHCLNSFEFSSKARNDRILRFIISSFKAAKGSPLHFCISPALSQMFKPLENIKFHLLGELRDLALQSSEWSITSYAGTGDRAIAAIVCELFYDISGAIDGTTGNDGPALTQRFKSRFTKPYWEHRSTVIRQLISFVKEKFLAGSLLENKDASKIIIICQLQWGMQAAFEVASRRQNFATLLDDDFVLSTIVKDIAEILSFDASIALYNGRGGHLTTHARYYQVLHIWIEAWIVANIPLVPDLVESWILDRHFYIDDRRYKQINDVFLGAVDEVSWMGDYVDEGGNFVQLPEKTNPWREATLVEKKEDEETECFKEDETSFEETLRQHPAASILF